MGLSNWITLIVALVGGVPGLITAYKFLNERPIFKVDIEGVMTGEMVKILDTGEEQRFAMLFLTLTLLNDGVKSMSPKYFDCSVKSKNRWIRLERMLIPGDFVPESKIQQIKFNDDAWKNDLQKLKEPLKPGDPIRGHLMFVTSDFTLGDLEKLTSDPWEFRLICGDVLGRKYPKDFKWESIHRSPSSGVLPKHGVSYEKKENGKIQK